MLTDEMRYEDNYVEPDPEGRGEDGGLSQEDEDLLLKAWEKVGRSETRKVQKEKREANKKQ